MTRFARARGSKSSNERVPEESTSWQVMKQQLEQKKQEALENKKRKEFEEVRKANYKAFLEEKDNDVKTEWAEFEKSPKKQANEKEVKHKKKKKKIVGENEIDDNEPKLKEIISEIEKLLDKDGNVLQNGNNKLQKESKTIQDTDTEKTNGNVLENKKRKEFEEVGKANYKNSLREKESNIKTQKKKKKIIPQENETDDNKFEIKEIISDKEKILGKESSVRQSENRIKQKKKSSKIAKGNIDIQKICENDDAPEEISAKITPMPIKNKIKVKLPKKAPLKIPSVNNLNEKPVEENVNSNEKVVKNDKNFLRKDKDKNKVSDAKNNLNKVKPKKSMEDLTEDQIKRKDKKKAKRMRYLERQKKLKAEQREEALEEQQNQNMSKHKLPKERDNKEHKRRKPNSQVTTVNINGVDIEIDYIDGFPIKKEDAERIRKLRKDMISKGIPRSEVQIALKLERRKAEKALAREKKKVCFNCRKSGHVLSECPNLNENAHEEIIGTGICFKCGSTEHTHFECKVVRNDNFKFATCFICQQQGHISRQCPDNQKGLYPKGGACKVCGDVTHLKKDCPKFQAGQESQAIKLDTLEFSNVESLPEEKQKTKLQHTKINKIVKF